MNTKTLEQFEAMSTEMLANIEGGNNVSAGEAGKALEIFTLGDTIIGGIIGSAPGAIAGGIYGAQYCTGMWALLRTH